MFFVIYVHKMWWTRVSGLCVKQHTFLHLRGFVFGHSVQTCCLVSLIGTSMLGTRPMGRNWEIETTDYRRHRDIGKWSERWTLGYQWRPGVGRMSTLPSLAMDLLPDTSNRWCACAGNAGNVSPTTVLAIPTCITARAIRTYRNACRDR